MGIAHIFASGAFLFFYSGLLVLLTAIAIVRNQILLDDEAKLSREIVKVVDAAHTRDASGKIEQLLLLNETTGARILTHDACRHDDLERHKVWQNPKFATARATANYLSLMAAVPAERHSLEGLRPARAIIEDEYRRLHKGLSGFGDFIIRVALLGTFIHHIYPNETMTPALVTGGSLIVAANVLMQWKRKAHPPAVAPVQ